MLSQGIWQELLAYQSHDFMRKSYERRHSRELNAQRTKEVTSCFIQAMEYFQSAGSAGTAVKPLLLYYGVLSLSKGIILSRDTKKREESLKPSHGLQAHDWQGVFSKGLRYILSISVEVTDGTFSELCTATNNSTSKSFWIDSPDGGGTSISLARVFPTNMWLDQKTIITLDDIVSRIPRLHGDYNRVLSKASNISPIIINWVGHKADKRTEDETFRLKLFDSSSRHPQFFWPGRFATSEQVRSAFRLPDSVRISEITEVPIPPIVKSFEFSLSLFEAYRDIDLPMLDEFPSGDSCVIWPFDNSGNLSPLLERFPERLNQGIHRSERI
jgi:hypothetical protein